MRVLSTTLKELKIKTYSPMFPKWFPNLEKLDLEFVNLDDRNGFAPGDLAAFPKLKQIKTKFDWYPNMVEFDKGLPASITDRQYHLAAGNEWYLRPIK